MLGTLYVNHSIPAAVWAVSLLAASPCAFAQDAACSAVVSAVRQQLIVPFHSYSTTNLDGPTNPLLPKQIKVESISTGKALYILRDGKWSPSPVTLEETRQNQESNLKTNKRSCRIVRDEAVDGVSSTLYSVHEETEDGPADSQIWIAKAGGLPMRMKMDIIDVRYAYANVVPPPTH